MATAAMISDCAHINHINPFTATNTFGTPTNGGFYDGLDGSYVVQIDESPMAKNDPNDDLTHFTPDHINRSGPGFLNEAAPSPAPFLGYPARKFEYPETFVSTWYRPGLETMPVPPEIKKPCEMPQKKCSIINQLWSGHLNKDSDILIILLLIALAVYVFR